MIKDTTAQTQSPREMHGDLGPDSSFRNQPQNLAQVLQELLEGGAVQTAGPPWLVGLTALPPVPESCGPQATAQNPAEFRF